MNEKIKTSIIDNPVECYGWTTPEGEDYLCYWGIEQRGAFLDLWRWDDETQDLVLEGSFRDLAKAKATAKARLEDLIKGVEDLWATE
jgi:hypothetical protein